MYLIKFDKGLLELGAIEVDSSQKWFVERISKGGDSVVEIINEKGLSRKFNVNREENLIQGRGIKGFFGKYLGNHICVEFIKENVLRLLPMPSTKLNMDEEFESVATKPQRINEVINRMTNIFQDDDKWFGLYSLSKDFSPNIGFDNLVSLPHLRDIEMYGYQIKAVKTILQKFRGRVLLCDEVGLGKTIEAGMAMMEYIMRGLARKILILVPPSLVDQWYFEIKRKFNQDFIRYDDPEFKKLGNDAWHHYSKVIASISTAKRSNNSDIITKIQYDLVIIDEAHHLKNRKTLAWQFANNLKKKYIFLLTATPVQNNLEELYNLITLLKPGQLKTYSSFKRNFISDNEGLEAKNTEKLRELLSGVMIRNKRSSVDVSLTKRKAVTLGLYLQSEEQKLYDDISSFIKERYLTKDNNTIISRFVLKQLQEEMGSSFKALVGTLGKLITSDKFSNYEREVLKYFYNRALKLTTMEFISNSPKFFNLLKILQDFNDKVLIFTKYKATQQVISEFLRNQQFSVAEFYGGMRRNEKEEQIKYFSKNAQVLVSTEAGGEGRNLQFCNGMINFDLPWNPMSIEQRIGRIHRVGQKRDIYVFNLAAKNTVEYYILDLLDRKINMFELVVGEVDMILGDLEEAESFSDIIMDAWVRSQKPVEMEKEIENLGIKMLENKKQYLKIKNLDNRLFEGL
jgi:SNF2 family DNA or RNA helicase